MKKLILALLLISPALGLADGPKVSVASKGNDVRLILADVFTQAKKSFVLMPNIQYHLFLSLQDTDFDKALGIICQQSNLTADLKDGVYYIHKSVPAPKPPTIAAAPAPAKLSPMVLKRRLTTRLSKAPLSTVIEAFSQQTGVDIEIDKNVPAYKLDAFLTNTSLGVALERVTRAANLIFRFTDHKTLLIEAPQPTVSLVQM